MKKIFCKTCSIQTVEEMEEAQDKKLFPRICIGHIALFLTGVFLVLMSWFGHN